MPRAKPATAKTYLAAIRSYHVQNGFPLSAFNDPRIDLVIKGAKRVYGVGVKKLRFPLTASILLRIINGTGCDEEGINVKAALCVAFAAFLRSGEFTWNSPWTEKHHHTYLSRKHVTFNPNNSVTLTLPISKTDPFQRGTQIHLAPAPSSPLCPVRSLKLLYNCYPRPPNHPLFSCPFGFPFSKQFFLTKLHELLLQAGIPTLGFSGHSIRKGAAVTAAINGISRDNIKLLGRWKSDAIDVYLNELQESDHITKLLSLNSQLQSPLSPNSPLWRQRI